MRERPKQRAADIVPAPAPTKGINDYDPLTNTDPSYAIDMLNFYPSNRSLKVRNGYREWITGLDGPAKTLMSYNKNNGTAELFACTDTGIYDATVSGVAGVPVTAITNGYLSWVNYANVAGQYLVAINGVDAGKLYDGTTWINWSTVAVPAAPGEVVGASISTMNMVHAHKKRLWFVEKDSMTAWYLPVDSVSGELKPFYLGGIFLRGGFLSCITTWSMDSGEGLEDILVFQSSEGELAGYIGPDPDTATTFGLEAVYYVGEPLGIRTNTDLGGDLALLTTNGITPISKVVGGTQAISNDEDTLTKNISRTFNNLLRSKAYSPNWQIENFPALTMMLVNFPDTNGTGAVQFIMNTLTGAWGTYNLPMLTMVNHQKSLYFSDATSRVLFYDITVNLDNVALDGSSGFYIVSAVQTAFSYLGSPGVNKIYSMIRPLFISTAYPSLLLDIGTDFRPVTIYDVPTPPGGPSASELWDAATWDITTWFLPNVPTSADTWDVGIWDETLWGLSADTQFAWIGVEGIGYSVSCSLKMSTATETDLVSFEWVSTRATSL